MSNSSTPIARIFIGIQLSLFALLWAQFFGIAQELKIDDPPPPPAASSATPTAQTPPGDSPDVLTRGVVHEAYAKPANANPEPGVIVEKKPPEPIEELPPDQKPEGQEVEWIPGYWSWDEESKDFDWISGFWRESPPGRDWVPGHWQQVEKGWMWVSGYWGPETQTEVQYLPAPPPSVEDNGPSVPAPDATSTFVPGIWVYQDTRYVWRPGFWTPYRPGWVWNPAYYTWSPSGYIFIDGYWDHPFGERGLLFAPVRFGPRFYAARLPYTPSYVIRTDFLFGALFIGPTTRSYYFGDYFDPRFRNRGYVSWPDYRFAKTNLDPNFNYYHHYYAGDARWETGVRDLYRARTLNEVARPPLTLNQQTQVLATLSKDRSASLPVRQNIALTKMDLASAVTPLKEVNNVSTVGLSKLSTTNQTTINNTTIKLTPVSKEARERDQKATERLNQISKVRNETESKLLQQGGLPYLHTDPAKNQKFDRPQMIPRVVSAPTNQVPPVTTPPGNTGVTKPPVTPPATPPVTNPPKTPPATPPVKPPVTPPATPPLTPPVKPPVSPPVAPPVKPPVTPPATPPVTPPVVKPPVINPPAPKVIPPAPTIPQNVPRQVPNFTPPRPVAPPHPVAPPAPPKKP